MRHLWPRFLIDWFDVYQRDMPWRTLPNPYYVWVSEMMLQQTQVVTVIPYFNRFIAQFPTIESIASADQQVVLKAWEGLGYYSRARNLHRAAQIIQSKFDGQLPADYDELQLLPGIGPYIAAAVTSIAFGNPVPVVDGNVLRVFTRFWGIGDDIRLPAVRDRIFQALKPIIQFESPSAFNQAIMELGALICTPANPDCGRCPIQGDCFAFQHHQTSVFPFKSKKPPLQLYPVAVGVVERGDQILIAQRRDSQMLGGLWEFPGGKYDSVANTSEFLKWHIQRETDVSVEILGELGVISHSFTHFKILVKAFRCRYLSGEAKPLASSQVLWVDRQGLSGYPFSKVGQTVISYI